jgi:hypothetical protein
MDVTIHNSCAADKQVLSINSKDARPDSDEVVYLRENGDIST